MKAFFSSQFGYCPLVWMFHNRRHNNKINRFHKRMLRIVYKDYKSSFAEHLAEDKSFTAHHKNVQKLAIEMYMCICMYIYIYVCIYIYILFELAM